jgi:hypothetical protein
MSNVIRLPWADRPDDEVEHTCEGQVPDDLLAPTCEGSVVPFVTAVLPVAPDSAAAP